MQAMAIGKDTLLQGEYRLLENLGGLESRVYLAQRVSARTSEANSALAVARLWQPSDELLHAYGAQALFERALGQMRAATLLRHPVLALVETCGGLDDGTLFMVSEHAEGTPLDLFVDKAGIPPLPSVIDLAYRVCSGLNTAHRNGLAHAALHPRSFIVRPQDDGGALTRLHVKLIDFGAPTCMFPSPPSLHAARFMAPEQLELALKPALERGEPTVRMNVYGCGALLYYLCTGGPPLPGQSVDELMVAHAAHKILPPSRINPQVLPALDAIILKALQPEPRARFANAAELANALISIRFERSASGVRHRAVDEARVPRDRRITAPSSEDVTHVIDASGLEERPTSKATRPPPLPRSARASDPGGFPLEQPTAVVRPALPSLPPLPPLTPLPPSVPPAVPEDEITAETPLPTQEQLAIEASVATVPPPRRSEPTAPPAVLARPARRSIAPVQHFLSRVPPAAFIAAAAVISLSIIIAVISQPSHEPDPIQVTPLPAMPRKRSAPMPAPQPDHDASGASSVPPTVVEPRAKPAPNDTPRERAPRRSARPSEAPARVPPAPEAAAPHDAFVLRPQLEAPPAPETAPEPEATPEPPPPAGEAPPAPSATANSERPAAARSPIVPLPEAPRSTAPKPLAPLPEKAAPRSYDVQVKGSLATSQVKRGIERVASATQSCYRAALEASPSALGELSVEVVIDERGRARSARVTGAAPSGLKRCLENVALRITAAPPDTGTVTATWKVSL